MTPGGPRMGGMSARRWRSMERRARADHERQLLSIIGRLAAAGARVVIDEAPCHRAQDPRVIVVGGEGWQLALVGTSALPVGVTDPGRPWHVAGAGRYGPYWWLRLAAGEDVTGQPVTMLAFHLQFDVAPGGAEIQPAPPLGHTQRNGGGVA